MIRVARMVRRGDKRQGMEEALSGKIQRGEHVSKDADLLAEEQLTFGQRFADWLSGFAGSWTFIIAFLIWLAVWMILNSVLLVFGVWDAYPYILLNLALSIVAALQGPVIMMSQNRQAARDRIRGELDYEVNLKAEMQVEQLHEKLDALRDKQWEELLSIQRQQLALLEKQTTLLQQMKS